MAHWLPQFMLLFLTPVRRASVCSREVPYHPSPLLSLSVAEGGLVKYAAASQLLCFFPPRSPIRLHAFALCPALCGTLAFTFLLRGQRVGCHERRPSLPLALEGFDSSV